ncbi:helix-turn-helix domain-containing protein [Chitinophaga sp. PC15]|uniref:Helix-turn-helix domain-containing protein n=2 Tax=Chitinophaga nivalis TaxID=2991709 RepID=A0ABT3INV6_9BACT|nr:helix-turn-helix domain-containing protein [Chitinophaga nivalis]MCW3485656.1 helix-turn-helix domain-containing protein [Chitinophaga nivalis]
MAIESDCWNKLRQVWEVSYGDVVFTSGLKDYLQLRHTDTATAAATPAVKAPAKGKVEKGSSRRGTLELYLGGKTIQDIAKERQLAIGTVESHLAQCIEAGEMDMSRFISDAKVKLITDHIRALGATAAGPIKERVGDAASFAEIRIVQWYLKKQQEAQIMND